MGADQEDLIQEGMIGLYAAARDYNPEKGAGFAAFAEICVNRKIITAVRAANRGKHRPLNSYVPISELSGSGIILGAEASDPESIVLANEDMRGAARRLNESLSGFEAEILRHYSAGKSYAEIAALTQKNEKSIDNALQRIKKKLSRVNSRNP